MCSPYKVLLLTMYPMCKSTANPLLIRGDRYVCCPFPASQLSQLLCFSASLPRISSPSSLSHLILPSDIPSDIPPCPGVSRRDHHAHSSLLPTPSPALGIQRCCSTAGHPLLPTAADQHLRHPPLTPPAPPISPPPSIQASLLHAAIPLPLYPTDPATYLPISYIPYHTYTYLLTPTIYPPPRTTPSPSPLLSLLLQS